MKGMMEISMIKNKEGENKKVMSCFPMKGHKANWLMLASGMGARAEWKVYIYDRKEKPKDFK